MLRAGQANVRSNKYDIHSTQLFLKKKGEKLKKRSSNLNASLKFAHTQKAAAAVTLQQHSKYQKLFQEGK